MENTVSQNAKTRCGNPYKTLLKLIISEPFSGKELRNYQKSITQRRFPQRIFAFGETVFHWFYKVMRRFGNALRKSSLGNVLPIILGAIFGKGGHTS